MQENSIYLLQFHDSKVNLGVYLINKLFYCFSHCWLEDKTLLISQWRNLLKAVYFIEVTMLKKR